MRYISFLLISAIVGCTTVQSTPVNDSVDVEKLKHVICNKLEKKLDEKIADLKSELLEICGKETPPPSSVPSHIKISDIKTIGELTRLKHEDHNFAQGIGLVVGLNGTGDTESPAAAEKLKNLLSRYKKSEGLSAEDLDSKNIAFVIVQAIIPPNAKIGDRVDVSVASAVTASSLNGGVLLQTYLEGPFQKTTGRYGKELPPPHLVWAQGKIEIDKNSGCKTAGTVKLGGIVLEEIPSVIYDEETKSVTLVLNHPDHVMAAQIVKAINGAREQLLPVGSKAILLAVAMDSKEIRIHAPKQFISYDGLGKPKLNNEFLERIKKVTIKVSASIIKCPHCKKIITLEFK